MKRNIKLVVVLVLLSLLASIGLALEAKTDNINGAAAHTIIGPVTPLIIGSLLIFFRMGFWKRFLFSWLVIRTDNTSTIEQ